jgi:hypothetical protein
VMGRRWGFALVNARKTHCWRGHDLRCDAYIFVDRVGRAHRNCRKCKRIRERVRARRDEV